jgi:hypothetical protein
MLSLSFALLKLNRELWACRKLPGRQRRPREVDGIMRFRWILKGSVSTTLLLSAVLAAWSDEVPVLNLEPVCRGIAQGAAGAGERGGPDLSFAKCVRSEQALRTKLVKEWSRYALADRQHCVAETTMGGLASYTNLLGCLKSATEARKMFPGRNRDYQIER